jgi:hypothetical protein
LRGIRALAVATVLAAGRLSRLFLHAIAVFGVKAEPAAPGGRCHPKGRSEAEGV